MVAFEGGLRKNLCTTKIYSFYFTARTEAECSLFFCVNFFAVLEHHCLCRKGIPEFYVGVPWTNSECQDSRQLHFKASGIVSSLIHERSIALIALRDVCSFHALSRSGVSRFIYHNSAGSVIIFG